MGRRVVALAAQDAEVELIGGVEHAGHPQLGSDLGLLASGSPLPPPVVND